MVIIRCTSTLKSNEFNRVYERLVEMARTGVILLPNELELLNEVPPDTEIVIVKEKGDDHGQCS